MIFLRNSNTTLQANCYILADDDKRVALVVDPGAGSAAWVAVTLKKHRLTLGAVLLTHGHYDHCWDASVVAGDNAPVYLAAPDLYRMDDPSRISIFSLSPFEQNSGHTWQRPARIEEIPPALFIGGGAELVPGVALRAIPMPGHT
ncbi:MAG: MBL fold metallo-hydrolase, partial [Actinomycetaceae bacterium]|nr:MBL fold metallo-hydrolase [Actinomycetaceae bacterium]